MPSPTPPTDPPPAPKPALPYWQVPGVRPGFDADAREDESGTAPGPRHWYSGPRWQMERERCHLSGPPQTPWRDPTPMAEVVASVVGRIGIRPSVALDYLVDNWPAIVGADVARHCRPVALEKGVLALSVAGAVWMCTLRRIAQTTLLSAVKKTPHGADVQRIALRPSTTGGGARP